ncbi:Mn(2+) uptake NRAMP transporter MntH [Candidatus Bathyarchaeota archaeon]|nr:MAG: Mn(2+) uptake NRAMP transporter MntH [Candidatus Bathyarchaeota archaeon]
MAGRTVSLGAAEVGSRLRSAANRVLKPPEEITKQAFKRLSLRSLFVYLGPSLIVSMAYMDPGNYGTDISSGASFAYDLLWTVWLANLMAMVLQYLSGKLGIATGKSLPELIKIPLKTKRFTIPYWLAAEAAAAATDLAEYLGTVIALNLLFNIPLIYASILGALDVIILLALTSERFRIIEYFFMVFVSIISIGFLYQIVLIQPSISNIAYHSFAVTLNNDTILLVVGIVGATVMPHALFVHSWLTKNKLTTGSLEEKRRHRRLHVREVILTLTIASLVNVAILVSAAAAFYPTYSGVSTISQAYAILKPLYGPLAAAVFAITLLASGLASSTTGTLAGQSIMDGLLGTHVNKYLRRLVTRIVNVFPTTLAILIGLNPLSLLVYSQVILSLMIPLPMIPLIIYTRRKGLMGEFVNKNVTTILGILSAALIIALNIYLLITTL